jgi:signal transduction histidine kinase
MHETLRLADEQLRTRVALLQATLEQAERLGEMLQVTNEELQTTNEELEITSTEIEMDNLELQTISQELRARLEKQQRARLQLEELNRLKDDFIGIASHEIKTPLTSILGNVQLAMRHMSRLASGDTEPTSEQQQIQHALQRAQVHVQRLTRLVNDLLDTSRIQSHTLQLCFDRCDLTTIVRNIVEEQRQLTPQQHLVLTLPQHPVKVWADADRIEQVISNYLSNAIKYNTSDQVVEVILQVEDHAGRLLLRDHGPGLSLPEQKRVWERFYRVPGIEARNGSGIGLGLGLAICRFIIEQHSGQVGVESMPGQGATFWFTLPITAQQAIDKDVSALNASP